MELHGDDELSVSECFFFSSAKEKTILAVKIANFFRNVV